MAKQIWLYSCVDAGMSLSCWIWNRTPFGQVVLRPPYEANRLVTIGCVSCFPVTISINPLFGWMICLVFLRQCASGALVSDH